MKNPLFNRLDLSCAGTILACKSQVCRVTGSPMYSEEFIQWAKEVMSYFAKAAWGFVKATGNSLKEAYVFIFNRLQIWNLPRPVYVIPEKMTGSALRRKASFAVPHNNYLILQA